MGLIKPVATSFSHLDSDIPIYAGSGTGTFKSEGNINVQVNAAGQGNGADTTEDTLFTYTLPANTFDNVGRGILIEAFGAFSATVANKTVKLYFGASVVYAGISAVSTTGIGWATQLMVYKTGASTQTAQGQAISGTTHLGCGTVIAGTETDTAAITIKVTGQSTVGTANTVTCNCFTVNFMN